MSIDLSVYPYCKNCGDFEPDVEKTCSHVYSLDINRYDTVIRCAHANRCKTIKEYLEKEKKR